MSGDGFDLIFQALDQMELAIERAAAKGAGKGAELLEESASDKEHEAIRGITYATFESTIAYVATAEDNGEDAAIEAATRASSRLEGNTRHDGQVELDTAEELAPNTIAIVLTVPTDYSAELELERDLGLLRALAATANDITTAIVREIEQTLR